LGYLAGVLSTLSPCVLPLLPILIGAALAQHRWGLWALAGGLALSYASVGVVWATVGSLAGIGPDALRLGGAALMVAAGLMLVVPLAQRAWGHASARWGQAGGSLLARLPGSGWWGQFAVGAVLGVVWTPCVGPTLGAALALAAQGGHAGPTAALMALFGLGAATPLLLLGAASRRTLARWRGGLLSGARQARWVLGAVLMATGALVLCGADKPVQAWVLDHSPAWLIDWTTRV
jgi:cytochrome c biogenesis protein CcdA